MSTTEMKTRSDAPESKLSPESYLKQSESKLDELASEYKTKPSKPLAKELLALARKVTIHRLTQAKSLDDLEARLRSIFTPPPPWDISRR